MWPSPRNPQIDPRRLHLRNIAQSTIDAINRGYVNFADAASGMVVTRHNIRVSAEDTANGTDYYRPESSRLKHWRQGPPAADAADHHRHHSRVEVHILKMSTLEGAHFLSEKCPASKIGVLNFASATKPGGGFINGASAQEESIARSSTLFVSLQTAKARPFYELHDQDDKGGYYSHAMIHSPSIAIFRDDQGQWIRPYHVDVVTSPAVNAGLVRKLTRRGRKSETEAKILSVMRERMGRVLALFELTGTRNLVLGSFGTGVFQNDVFSLAKIWGELLAPGTRFAHSFDKVVFAIPDSSTRRKFQSGYDAATSPPRIWFPGVL